MFADESRNLAQPPRCFGVSAPVTELLGEGERLGVARQRTRAFALGWLVLRPGWDWAERPKSARSWDAPRWACRGRAAGLLNQVSASLPQNNVTAVVPRAEYERMKTLEVFVTNPRLLRRLYRLRSGRRPAKAGRRSAFAPR